MLQEIYQGFKLWDQDRPTDTPKERTFNITSFRRRHSGDASRGPILLLSALSIIEVGPHTHIGRWPWPGFESSALPLNSPAIRDILSFWTADFFFCFWPMAGVYRNWTIYWIIGPAVCEVHHWETIGLGLSCPIEELKLTQTLKIVIHQVRKWCLESQSGK